MLPPGWDNPPGNAPAGSISNTELADMTAGTVKGRAVGAGTGVPTDLTAAQQRAAAELGTIATQAASAVAITGGTVSARLAYGSETALNIASGAITITGNYHAIETEGAVASDDVTTINGGLPGQILVLYPYHPDHSVVMKDGATLLLAGDFTMDNAGDTITLIANYDATVWRELCRSDTGA